MLGIDVGGSKIAAGLVDHHRSVVVARRVPTPRTGGADVMAQVCALAADLAGQAATLGGRVTGVGLGVPGTVDVTRGRVVAASDVLPGWAGTDVSGPLGAQFDVPIAVDNDVRATGLAEARHGAGRHNDRVLVVSLGTGVGGAVVVGGRLVRGGHGTTGEVAHLLVPDDGPIRCGCGRRDHLEAHASGPAIAARYLAGGGDQGEWAREAVGGAACEPDRAALGRLLPSLVTRWRCGDAVAGTAIMAAADLAGRALAGLAGAIDVDAVVLGGGVAEIGPEFLDPLRAAFAASVIAPLREIPVVPAALGGKAPLIGAAELLRVGGIAHRSDASGGTP